MPRVQMYILDHINISIILVLDKDTWDREEMISENLALTCCDHHIYICLAHA